VSFSSSKRLREARLVRIFFAIARSWSTFAPSSPARFARQSLALPPPRLPRLAPPPQREIHRNRFQYFAFPFLP
jgi:hypothetical protein